MAKPKVLMILTRPLSTQPQSGREKINLFIYQSLLAVANIEVAQYHHLLHSKRLGALIYAGFRFLWGQFTGKRLPLQALLFSDKTEINRLVQAAVSAQPANIFVESERSLLLLTALRKALPTTRIICDFDDLMSRRMEEWASHNNQISLGYIARFIPQSLHKLISGPLAGWLCHYEANTLRSLELACFNYADQIILLSAAEGAMLKDRLAKEQQSKLQVIPPACALETPLLAPAQPIRFVFIGSDSLLQNRQTIDYLVKQWQQLKPQTPLVIYGRMTRSYPDIPNLRFAGFATTLDEVYTTNSVLLAPAFVKGGIKTKVLEALEHGITVVGNPTSWEGIYQPARFADSKTPLISVIQNPKIHLAPFFEESQAACAFLRANTTSDQIALLWQRWCLLPNSV